MESSAVGYDGAVRDEEHSVWQTKPERDQKEETKQSRWGFRGMTVRDWLPIVGAFLVPVAVALGTGWITWQLAENENQRTQEAQKIENQRAQQAQKIENQRARAERNLAEQRAQDEALQGYLDQMGNLLLEKGLRTSKEDSDVRTLARARTLTVLGRLDPSRKTAVMQFLVEAELVQSVDERDPIMSLAGADLSGASLYNLSSTNLNGAELSRADLSEASLDDVNLSDANLSDANLHDAVLRGTNLNGAYLDDAYLGDADLYSARLEGAYLRDTALPNANLYRAKMNGANLHSALSSFANFSHADLSDANLSSADIVGCDLRHADLSDADLSNVILMDANLSRALGVTKERLEQQTPTASLPLVTMPDGTGYAGLYYSVEFMPSLSFKVSDGWKLAWPQKSSPYASGQMGARTPDTTRRLALDGPKQVGELTFTSPLRVFDPSNVSERREVPAPESADEWVSWFQRHPNLETSEPIPVNVGGRSGWRIDVKETPTPENYPQHYCHGRCVPLFPTDYNSEIVSSVEMKDQFIIMDVERKTVVIDVGAPPDKFEEFLPKARKVLDTVEWEGA